MKCYLCNKEISGGDVISKDHVVQKLLIDRKQPKVKGFDYGGFLPTHQKCNNCFGPEAYCRTALQVISRLSNPACISIFQHKKDPELVMMALNSECFKEFSSKELEYFKITDVRENSMEDLQSVEFIKKTPKTRFEKKISFTAFAVLTKSAVAYLLSREYLESIPSQWEVIVIPYFGATQALSFDEILGKAEVFDVEVRVYSKKLENSHGFFVVYIAHGVLLYIFFKFSQMQSFWNGIIESFPEAEHYYFKGKDLNELLDYQWKKI